MYLGAAVQRSVVSANAYALPAAEDLEVPAPDRGARSPVRRLCAGYQQLAQPFPQLGRPVPVLDGAEREAAAWARC